MAKTTTAIEPSETPHGDVPVANDDSSKAQLKLAALRAEPKRMVRIPIREGQKQRFSEVWVNGHPFQIMRGVDVEVPQTVYEILVNAGEI